MKKELMEKGIFWFLCFLVYSVAGWIYELGVYYFEFKEGLVNRGFAFGPYLPIYGVGAVILMLLKKSFGKKIPTYFSVSVAWCAALEYGTSWLMEYIYNVRWWDYTDLPLNLNGRIFLGGLLGFGIAGLGFSYLLFPKLENAFHKLPAKVQKAAIWLVMLLFLLDAIYSAAHPNMGVGITS